MLQNLCIGVGSISIPNLLFMIMFWMLLQKQKIIIIKDNKFWKSKILHLVRVPREFIKYILFPAHQLAGKMIYLNGLRFTRAVTNYALWFSKKSWNVLYDGVKHPSRNHKVQWSLKAWNSLNHTTLSIVMYYVVSPTLQMKKKVNIQRVAHYYRIQALQLYARTL